MMVRGKVDGFFGYIAAYLLLRVIFLAFESSIYMGFQANQSANSFEGVGIVSRTLKSNNPPAYVVISGINYTIYLSENSAYKEDFIKAKVRRILLGFYTIFAVILLFFLDKAKLANKLKVSSKIFSIGITFFTLGIASYACDRIWFINFFFSKTRQILPLISSYSATENVGQAIFLILFCIGIIYYYRKAK